MIPIVKRGSPAISMMLVRQPAPRCHFPRETQRVETADRPISSRLGENLKREPVFDRQASATDSVSFLGLFPPKAGKTVFFFVSFHQGATQSGILFLVSIKRGTSRRVYSRRP